MIQFLVELYDSMENGVVSGVLFLDLKKAFDLVNHDLLLGKLEYAGLTESALSWFKSYLDGRNQITKINHALSDLAPVNYGVPWGTTGFEARTPAFYHFCK